MVVTMEMWDSFLTYLVIEKKLSAQPNSRGELYLKSRFRILTKHFASTPFNRESFNVFLFSMNRNGYSNAYLNNLIKMAKHLHGFLLARYSYDSGLAEYTYFRKEKTLVEPLTIDEIKSLAEVYINYRYHQEETNRKYKTLIYTLAMTGARIGEILSLEKRHVFESHIVIYGSKVGEERMVPISPFLKGLLQEQIESTTSPYVFAGKSHERIHSDTFNSELKRRAEAIGLKKRVYAHIFRHSFVVQMLKEGVSVVHISRICGHRSLESINSYSHLLLEDLMEAVSYHPLMQQNQGFDTVKGKVKKFFQKLTNANCNITVREDRDSLAIVIQK